MPPDNSNFNPSLPPLGPSLPSLGQPVIVTASSPTPKKKYLLAGLAVLTLIAGVITAVVLVQRQAGLSTQAWNCSAYNFNVSKTGVVTADNQSQYSEPAQKVSISINGSPSGILNVPALTQGASATIGTVTVPAGGAFTWKAVGTLDCQDSGTYLATPTVIPSPTDKPDENITPTIAPSPTTTPTNIPTPTKTPTPTIILTPTTTPPVGGPDPTPTFIPSPTPTEPPTGSGPTATPGPTGVPDPTATPIVQNPPATPTPITQLPQSGSTDTTWIVSSAALLLLGIAALLFAL